jgi:predicted AlkP superfamily pyrophosphatase or phosphodiesterase
VSRVLIVSIDGLRPDVLLRANAPVLRGLMERGSFSMWAFTTPVAVTLPSHTSMLTGVAPEKHGITWNHTLSTDSLRFSKYPTLFERARASGYTTAMAAGKSKFNALAKPGTLNSTFIAPASAGRDEVVADSCIAIVARTAPQVLFLHLPEVDSAGHDQGWGSAAQLAAIAVADGALGRVLDALRTRGVLDSTLVIVSSDHGGAGKSHGPDDPRSRHIPWIAAGPEIRANLDLTGDDDLQIRTEDTFATACFFLGIATDADLDGHPVLQILQDAHAADSYRATR